MDQVRKYPVGEMSGRRKQRDFAYFFDLALGFPLIILKPAGKALRPEPPFTTSPSPRLDHKINTIDGQTRNYG